MRKMLRSQTCFVILFLVLLHSSTSVDPVLSPATLSDSSGNSANENSTITWAPLPTGESYKAGDTSYDDGGLGPLYDFARSFVNTALPVDFPYATITDLANGALDMGQVKDLVLDNFIGYIACVAIGFLFIIIFPIVGCCLCCCRCCCNNCGGKMVQKTNSKTPRERLIFCGVLAVLIIFTMVGLICTYVSNDRFGTAIDNFKETSENNLDDIDTFVNNTVLQLKHLINVNIPFLQLVVFRDLENLGYILGIPVRDKLKVECGLGDAFASAKALSSSISSTYTAFSNVNTSLETLKTELNTLSSELSDAKTAIDLETGNPTLTADLASGSDASDFPDISSEMDAINSANSQDMNSLVTAAEKEFEDIPSRIHNETSSKVTDVKTEFTDYRAKLDPMFDDVLDIDTNLKKSFDTKSLKSDLESAATTAGDYDKYRWYGGVGLASIILLVVVLEFIGLIFGFFGSSSNDEPTERGCLSTAGGNMLMASVGFIFIFSPLLMLLTTLTFTIAAPLEKFLCQPLSDPDFVVITKLLDENDLLMKDGYFLGDALFQNKSIPLTFKGVLQDCKAGKTAYTAMKLNNLINLDDLTNFRSVMNIDSTIDSMSSSVDLSSIEVLTPELKKNLEDFNSSANVNFTAFTSELSNNVTQTNLNDLADNLDASPGGLDNETAELRRIQSQTVPRVENAKADLKTKLDALETELSSVSGAVTNALDKLQASQDIIQTNGTEIVVDELKNLLDRILDTVDSLVNDVVDGLNNELGRCTPVYNMFYSFLVVGLCKYGIDILNGFWFTIGWCIFFFVPSVVFSVKLAKHFRRMKFSENDDSFKGVGCPSPNQMSKPPENHMPSFSPGNNKVGHADF